MLLQPRCTFNGIGIQVLFLDLIEEARWRHVCQRALCIITKVRKLKPLCNNLQ